MAALTLDSQRQYEAMGVNVTCGGIEIARKPERLEEFRRRMTSATAWGIEAELLTPDEVGKLVPFVNTDIVLGGFYTPSVSVVDSLRAGTIFRERAIALGALQTVAVSRYRDEVANGRANCRHRPGAEGEVRGDRSGGSPRIAAMAGATIPLTPAVHQMIDVGPIPELEATGNEIGFPIVRDMDTFCYERQTGGSMEGVGRTARSSDCADDILSIEQSRVVADGATFISRRDLTCHRRGNSEETPDFSDHRRDEVRDQRPVADPLRFAPVAPAKRLRWATSVGKPCAWIKEGPGVGRMIAEWMTHGSPEIDPHHSDIT